MTHGVHKQIGKVVGRVAALAGHAAHAHVHKGLVAGEELGAALAGEPHHFRHLDQHAAREVERLVFGHAARLKVGLEEGIHVLVHTSDGHAGLVFLDRQQGLHGPYGLNGLPECGGRMGGHTGVDFGNFQQFGLAPGVAFPGGQFRRVLGHAAGVGHHAFGGVDDGFVEIDFVQIIGVFIIQMFQMLTGFALDIQHPLFHQDDVVAGVGVSAAVQGVVGAVGHERLAGKFPYSRFAVLGFAVFVNGLAFPVGEDFIAQDLFVFFGNIKGILRAVGDGIQFVTQPAPGNIRREGTHAGAAAGAADDQFIVLNDQRRGFAAAAEGFGAQFDLGQAGVFLVDFGDDAGAVNGNAGYLLQEVFLQALVAFGGAFGDDVSVGACSGSAGRRDRMRGFLKDLRGDAFKYFPQGFALRRRQVPGRLCNFAGKVVKIHYASSVGENVVSCVRGRK